MYSTVDTSIEADICKSIMYKLCLDATDKKVWMKLGMSLGSSSWNFLSQMFDLIGSQSTNSFPTVCELHWANVNYIFI